MKPYPSIIEGLEQLDEVLTRPSDALIDFVASMQGRLVILGAGGKMGPSLCVSARRAADASNPDLKVVAVSRFTNPDQKVWLEDRGIRTIPCDLANRGEVDRLPEADTIIYLVGRKFGTSGQPELTWVINTLVPSLVAERYKGVPTVMLSTGNVYPLTSAESGGSVETDDPNPIGEYAYACLARERLFEYFAHKHCTPTLIVRLNYAVDLRYGVLHDLAQQIMEKDQIDLSMNHLNCIWQGEANDRIIRSLGIVDVPAKVLNLTGPIYPVKYLVQSLAKHLNRKVEIRESQHPTSLLSNAGASNQLLGKPEVSIEMMIRWTAHWILNDYPTLNKPTHFEARDGSF